MESVLKLDPTAGGKKRISIYQPEQEGLIFPEIPEFKNFEEERQYRKKHLVAACRAFAEHSLDYGFAGHLTVRDPEFPELYWTNPMAVHFSQVKMSNLILADHKGKVVQGDYAINRAGFVLHAAVHEAHPDIVAMCHAHTIYGGAWASTGRPLLPITQDAAVFFEDHVVITAEAGAVAVETKAGNAVCDYFKDVRAAIHQNHGLLTASRHSIDEAAFAFHSGRVKAVRALNPATDSLSLSLLRVRLPGSGERRLRQVADARRTQVQRDCVRPWGRDLLLRLLHL